MSVQILDNFSLSLARLSSFVQHYTSKPKSMKIEPPSLKSNLSLQCTRVRECVRKRSSTSKFESSPRLNDDDWIISSSTPPLFSFSESEMDQL
ncbi:unnamed protein product [Heterotrigona itama]|uniref:Uncharacterized protein n=1 Tax=Heterotrigona itama TaxID=395501 RepID=A0A6V7H290_9HYME|nr:unnamed protein product [Heterotrigona itama]